MLFWKLHILFKSHAFLRNGMKEHKDCIRLCLLRVKVWKKFIRRTQEILKKKSWSLDPRSLLKCVKSTNVNISNEVSFFALWSDTLGSKGHLITLKHTQMKLMTKSADIHSMYNSYRWDIHDEPKPNWNTISNCVTKWQQTRQLAAIRNTSSQVRSDSNSLEWKYLR